MPLLGTISAGYAQERPVEIGQSVAIDVGSLGVARSGQTFALEVRGDSMIARHIMDGDTVIVDRSRVPKSGDVVAALIDDMEDGRPILHAENPNYPDLVPANELLVQGVMVALVRKCQ